MVNTVYPVVVTGGYELATPTIVEPAPTIVLDIAGVCSERSLFAINPCNLDTEAEASVVNIC